MAKTKKESIIKKTNLTPNDLFRKINTKTFILAVVVLLLLVGLFAYYRYGVVAVVNGRYVSRLEYIKNMEKQVGKQTLEQMVNESLIMSEADKKNVKIEQSVIDSEISKIDEQIKAQGQTLEAALTAEGMTRGDLEKQIRIQMLVEELSDPKVEITQAQIDEFLNTNKDQLPEDISKEELQTLAKDQLQNQAKNEAITNWLANLRKEAKVSYR